MARLVHFKFYFICVKVKLNFIPQQEPQFRVDLRSDSNASYMMFTVMGDHADVESLPESMVTSSAPITAAI